MNIVFIIFISIIINILLFTLFYFSYCREVKIKKILYSHNNFINYILKDIEDMYKKIKELDIKGSFESDDEIGFLFKEIKKIIGRMNDFNKNMNNDLF